MIKYLLLCVFVICTQSAVATNKTTVTNGEELQQAALNAKPGDVIVLLKGNYGTERISIEASGTKELPILIEASTPETAFIEGRLVLKGKFVVLKNISFIKNGHLELFGKGHRITQCVWDDSESGKWLKVLPGSMQVEIDHNTFKNKVKSNTTMDRSCQLLQVLVRNNNERHHIHHNVFKDIAKGKTANGYEVIQLRSEFNKYVRGTPYCNSIIENNLFLRCFGESEIVSIKSNGNIVRNNTIRASRGGLVLRHGEGSVVSGNYFLGEGLGSSGGIRVAGIDHVVSNNYMQDLGLYSIAMMDGTPDGLYTRVENVTVQFNTFVNCKDNFKIGLNHEKHPNGTVPRDCKVIGNVFHSDDEIGSGFFVDFIQNDIPENWTVTHNIAFGKRTDNLKGITNTKTGLTVNGKGLFIPSSETDSIQLSELNTTLLKYDLFGQPYEGNLITVGAIQFPVGENTNPPLNEGSFAKP